MRSRCARRVRSASRCATDPVRRFSPVGVGKSAFATAFVRAMQSDRALLVPSPSFLLQQWYRAPGRVPVCHMDFFRMKSEDELRKLGLQEAAREGALADHALTRTVRRARASLSHPLLCVAV